MDKSKGKSKLKTHIAEADKAEIQKSDQFPDDDNVVKIRAIYEGQYLTHIKFEMNPKIPRLALKIVGMAISHQPYLTALTIKRGLTDLGIYEISKFLPFSFLTDICLDGSYVPQGNFYLLLEIPSYLRYLSLSSCNINDDVLKIIASTLQYPKHASTTLALLNLSCNFITNTGAKYLAEALRTNRRLNYLNLSSNQLDDEGVSHIFNILLEFPLTYDEIIDKKSRYLKYLKKKMVILENILKKLKSDEDKKMLKRKTSSPNPTVGKKAKEGIVTAANNDVTKRSTIDAALYAKANDMAIEIVGEFIDPFNKENTFINDGYTYCLGNNSLCYLNLSYNNLMYPSVKKLLSVLSYQKWTNRKPQGLMKVVIEGNNLPESCLEYLKIDELLTMAISPLTRRMSIKKRVPRK